MFYLFERRVIRTELKVMTSLMYNVIFKIKVFLLIYPQLLIFTQIVIIAVFVNSFPIYVMFWLQVKIQSQAVLVIGVFQSIVESKVCEEKHQCYVKFLQNRLTSKNINKYY